MEWETLIQTVTACQSGDRGAADALFTEYYNSVYYFALKTVRDSDLACDITQEAFLEAFQTIGKLNEPAAFVTWMKQITYHPCTRYFKKEKDVPVEEDEDGNTLFDTLADESETTVPSEIYEKEEFRKTILSMIDELSEEQCSAVMLYYFDELPVGQIAGIQGVSEGKVKPPELRPQGDPQGRGGLRRGHRDQAARDPLPAAVPSLLQRRGRNGAPRRRGDPREGHRELCRAGGSGNRGRGSFGGGCGCIGCRSWSKSSRVRSRSPR